MGNSYDQLCLSERIEIYRLHEGGRSLRAIAAALGRSASTVSREIRRNGRRTKAWPGGYQPERAQDLADRRRRWDGRFKLARQPALRALVRDRLAMGWSPEQIAGRLARTNPDMTISHEAIYRFIYHRTAQKDYWHRLLPKARFQRGRPGRRGGSPIRHFTAHRSIHDRPVQIEDRRQPGHWEADLMMFSKYGQALLVLHERQSRYTHLARLKGKASGAVLKRMTDWFQSLHSDMRRSVTFDNGTEFAQHHRLNETLGIETFFCDTHSPWQKGGVENAILRLRRHLARKTDITKITQSDIADIQNAQNQTPRKCLGFKTPFEVFNEESITVALQT